MLRNYGIMGSKELMDYAAVDKFRHSNCKVGDSLNGIYGSEAPDSVTMFSCRFNACNNRTRYSNDNNHLFRLAWP